MTNHVVRKQSLIVYCLFSLLLILILVKIIFPEVNVDDPFFVITGWLGIVIGFFFNNQFTEHLRQKLRISNSIREKIAKDFEMQLEGVLKEKEAVHKEILKGFEKRKK